jgi:hypothetical protein
MILNCLYISILNYNFIRKRIFKFSYHTFLSLPPEHSTNTNDRHHLQTLVNLYINLMFGHNKTAGKRLKATHSLRNSSREIWMFGGTKCLTAANTSSSVSLSVPLGRWQLIHQHRASNSNTCSKTQFS